MKLINDFLDYWYKSDTRAILTGVVGLAGVFGIIVGVLFLAQVGISYLGLK